MWIPDRESEGRVEQEVTPRSFEPITSDGITLRRNQSSVHQLLDKPREEPVPESSPVQPPEHQDLIHYLMLRQPKRNHFSNHLRVPVHEYADHEIGGLDPIP